MKQSYYVKGMMCAGCTKSVEKSIRSLDGVEAVNVNLASETATIIFDESRIRLERIAEEVRKSGYELELPDSTENTVLQVSGMHCSVCVGSVEKSLLSVGGVTKATVNLSSEKAFVEYDSTVSNVGDLINAIEEAGYHATPENGEKSNKLEKKKERGGETYRCTQENEL